jgi:predicted AAA+ superfamily ATPase
MKVMYWREGGAEVDFLVKTQRGIVAIEVKSGRVKRIWGLGAVLPVLSLVSG